MICENCEMGHSGSYGSGRFCSSTCARGFSTKQKRHIINATVSKKMKGRESTSKGQTLKCTEKMQDRAEKFREKKKIEKENNLRDFLEGKNLKNNPKTIRGYLLYTRKYECEDCGNVEWKGRPIPLQVEHIDGNWENNIPENLKLLCPNCHALTPTWGCKNKGNGRYYRRIRYSEGKSS